MSWFFLPFGTFGVIYPLLVEFFELFLNPLTYEYSPLKFKLTIQAHPQPVSTLYP